MPRILIAEDSPVIQRTLRSLLEGEEGIEVVGIANNGVQAIEMCKKLSPDLVTMDIYMPEMDGLEATRRIMNECPTRIVIISAMANDMSNSFEAMRAGAIEVIEKPRGILAGNYQQIKNNLKRLVHTMANEASPTAQLSWMPSLTNKTLAAGDHIRASLEPMQEIFQKKEIANTFKPKIVCIGGSTGAPTVVVEVLSTLPKDYPYPIIVAQHIARKFAKGFARWVNNACNLDVALGENGDTLEPGKVYICPDDKQLLITKNKKIQLVDPLESQVHIPCIDLLFDSAIEVYKHQIVGILLSGMGQDGAKSLKRMHDIGSVTLTQSEETSVIYGMASVAMGMGAVMKSISPIELAEILLDLKNR